MRIKIKPTGELIIPPGQLKALGVKAGQDVNVTYEEGKLIVTRHVLDDPFKDLHKKKPSASEQLDKAFAAQAEQASRAKEAFEKALKDPPKVTDEDRRDFWD